MFTGQERSKPQRVVSTQNEPSALVGERLTLIAFHQLCGNMGGYPFVKIVVERLTGKTHFINNDSYLFHADYIAECILGKPREEIRKAIDAFNQKVYLSPDRDYLLGILSLHQREAEQFYALETVEIDNMNIEMVKTFFSTTKQNLEPSIPVLFKPANHLQETMINEISANELPRVLNHELFASKDFVPLNCGEASGRLRVFSTEEEFKKVAHTIEWYDIIVMNRVPDSIPRVSGIINAKHTTPLSHTNVLACGWQIPNAVQLGIINEIERVGLNEQWVKYSVAQNENHVRLSKIEKPKEKLEKPAWTLHRIRLEEPETENTPILSLDSLRMSDRFRYGTKAANLGELRHILKKGSGRLTGFYRVPRPPRENLMSYIMKYLGSDSAENVGNDAWEFLKRTVSIPRGLAIPFSVQQEFLESSPKIQQAIGKLKMALELEVKEVDEHCLLLQQLIRTTRISDRLRDSIDQQIATHLGGTSSFVVRSSSNAEDLPGFSAAGIYESMNHVTTAENIFESIREVWASLISPRSVRLRHEVGISLDDSYMGVIVQEEVSADMGGVLVTTNPMNPSADFRSVFINVSDKSVVDVVEGRSLPYQYLFNTVEGGGSTLSIGNAKQDLSIKRKQVLQKLAFCGRLLQSHFSQDYTFSSPADIEWAAKGDQIFILQLRPYAI
jgi:hypothetical protein